MKNYAMALVLLLTTLAFTGCKKEKDEKLIVGKWKLEKEISKYYENGVLIDEDVDTDDGGTAEIFDNGRMKDGDNNEYTYVLNGKTFTITLVKDPREVETFEITTLTKESLVIYNEDSYTRSNQNGTGTIQVKETTEQHFIKQ